MLAVQKSEVDRGDIPAVIGCARGDKLAANIPRGFAHEQSTLRSAEGLGK